MDLLQSMYDWLQDLVLAIYESLLPARYRSTKRHIHKAALGGMLCASAEFVFCTLLWLRGYALFFAMRNSQILWHVAPNRGTQTYMIWMVTLEYIFFHPASLILEYFAFEGAVRAWSIAFTGTILPTLPLKLIAVMQERSRRKQHERQLGPTVPDAVEHLQGEYELCIASHKPKEGWRVSIALSYQGEIYQLVKLEQGKPPRSSVYLFRRYPAGQVIRGLYTYSQDMELSAPAGALPKSVGGELKQ
jgi:hypothetical protein